MARKTKRQKVLAARRRDSSVQKTMPAEKSQIDESTITYTSVDRSVSVEDRQETEYFKQDFRKSFLYITAILSLEILLYVGIAQYHLMK